MAFRAAEKATLVVNGRLFEDWTSVSVTHRYNQAYPTATFECTEKIPTPTAWPALQFKPGDSCRIWLAGILAITGHITHRQVGYDAENHGVQLTVLGKTHDLAECSVAGTAGTFDGYPWVAIARKLISPFGIGLETVGNVDGTPFEQMTIQPGELVWSTLERLARFRKIVLGSTERGNLLAAGPERATVVDRLVEGVNILRANCTIADPHIYQKYWAIGQRAGNDDVNGSEASELVAMTAGSANRYRPIVTVAEHPETQEGLQKRSEYDALFNEGQLVTAQVTVQGWLRGNTDLWRVGTCPHVWSPMMMVNQPLAIQEATFKQDNSSGTTTTLELVAPWFLNKHLDWGPGQGPPAPGQIVP